MKYDLTTLNEASKKYKASNKKDEKWENLDAKHPFSFENLGAAGGAIAGSTLGPAGTLAGMGIGYLGGKAGKAAAKYLDKKYKSMK